jgi:hypothetical protein
MLNIISFKSRHFLVALTATSAYFLEVRMLNRYLLCLGVLYRPGPLRVDLQTNYIPQGISVSHFGVPKRQEIDCHDVRLGIEVCVHTAGAAVPYESDTTTQALDRIPLVITNQ